jgi:hypothetical protein
MFPEKPAAHNAAHAAGERVRAPAAGTAHQVTSRLIACVVRIFVCAAVASMSFTSWPFFPVPSFSFSHSFIFIFTFSLLAVPCACFGMPRVRCVPSDVCAARGCTLLLGVFDGNGGRLSPFVCPARNACVRVLHLCECKNCCVMPRVHAPARILAGANTRARMHGYTPAKLEANDDYGIYFYTQSHSVRLCV